MNADKIELIRLEPMRVASAWAFGPNPEEMAWQKLTTWATPLGLLTPEHRIFGFNNPNPSAGSPNYGYEYWITVAPDVTPGDGVRIVEALGGLYAVLYADVSGNYYETIPAAWQRLDSCVAASVYRHGSHQWLEEHSIDGIPFAFYYPVVE